MHSSKSESPTSVSSPGVLKVWIAASRPKTWVASLCPVILALALQHAPVSLGLAACCLLFSLLIQIGCNFANDYYDFVNGVDQLRKAGPQRAVASGWIAPQAMQRGMSVVLGAAALASWPLIDALGPITLPFIATSIAFAILYTGGPRPLGYLGLGELLVFLYFGPVALLGTYFVQTHTITWAATLLSCALGAASCAILVANNLRDEESDRAANKRTLIVRLGTRFGRCELTTFLAATFVLPLLAGFWWHLLSAPLLSRVLRQTWTFTTPQEAEGLLPKCAALLGLTTLLLSLQCVA